MHKRYFSLLVLVVVMLMSASAAAGVPQVMTYQGRLTDMNGEPADTVLSTLEFAIIASDDTELWTESHSSVDVNDGTFSVQLGSVTSLDASVFSEHDNLRLQITVEGDTMSPATPIDSLPYALHAKQADDAQTLQGQTPAELAGSGEPASADAVSYDNATSGLSATDLQAAVDELAQLRARVDALETNLQDSNGNTIDVAALDNRVSQTETSVSGAQSDIAALQTEMSGAQSDIAALQTDMSAVQSEVATLQTAVQDNADDVSFNQSEISSNTSSIDALETDMSAVQSEVATLQTDVSANQNEISSNTNSIDALETKTQDMSRFTDANNHPTVAFDGVNVMVRSGAGSTDAMPNGKGNLIVGYNEGNTLSSMPTVRSGSHNLVVGLGNSYGSYAGIIGGSNNGIAKPYAAVLSGSENLRREKTR